MVGSNYDNELWPLVYDQLNTGRHEKELAFYLRETRAVTGPVLEGACGTGMILLGLLQDGRDAYGFDISAPMVSALFEKATSCPDIRSRVSVQNLVDFKYPFLFGAICIPARSFLHLTTQDEQIRCLTNVAAHLEPGGRLLLNFFNPDLGSLLQGTKPPAQHQPFRTFSHPRDHRPIHVTYRQSNDLLEQRQEIEWRFAVDGREHETSMSLRWIYRNEFELLLRLAGLRVVRLYGDFDGSGCTSSSPELIWIAEKAA